MSTFTIDSENNITALAEVPAGADEPQHFPARRNWPNSTGDWPVSRLVETWNSFAGVAPFDELKPVKKFTSRKAAVTRIWAGGPATVPGRRATGGRRGARQGEGEEVPGQGSAARPGAKGRHRSALNKKAEVIAMMKRAKGATLAEIMEATGWQKHTVRGFVSILGSKGGQKIESSKNAAGERSYRIAK